jgi:hypothetical protein
MTAYPQPRKVPKAVLTRELARITRASSGYEFALVSSTRRLVMTVLSGGRKRRRRRTVTAWLWGTAISLASFVAAAAVIARI